MSLFDIVRRTVLVALGGAEGAEVRQLVVDDKNRLYVNVDAGTVATSTATPPTPATHTFPSSGTLPAAAAWLIGPTVTVGALELVTWSILYSGAGSGAQLGFEVLVGHADGIWNVLPVVDGTITVLSVTGTQAQYDQAIAEPVTGATPYRFGVSASVKGWPYCAIRVRELVQGSSTQGTVTLATQGGAY